ncbi:MAG TPA: recombinase family protein [Blastocatellia bacterium]|nr:recombinase family protein [Blastocatellia bacterium]
MQSNNRSVALIEPAAGNVDAAFQRATLKRYAESHHFEISHFCGDRAPLAGAAGNPEHKNLINEIRGGAVGRLLILADVRHAVPEEVLEECRKAGVEVIFVDVQQERGLTQTT